MIKVLKKLATNKKGSEVVKKILMVAVIAFIVSKINEAAGEEIAGADADGVERQIIWGKIIHFIWVYK